MSSEYVALLVGLSVIGQSDASACTPETVFDPVFNKSTYEFEVGDGTGVVSAGTYIGTVTVTVNESCISYVTFKICYGDIWKTFKIQKRGRHQKEAYISVATKMTLIKSEKPYYNMLVTANDGYGTGTATIVITFKCDGATLVPTCMVIVFMLSIYQHFKTI